MAALGLEPDLAATPWSPWVPTSPHLRCWGRAGATSHICSPHPTGPTGKEDTWQRLASRIPCVELTSVALAGEVVVGSQAFRGECPRAWRHCPFLLRGQSGDVPLSPGSGEGHDGLVQSPEGASVPAVSCSVYRQAALLPGLGEGVGQRASAKMARGWARAWSHKVSEECQTPGGVTLRTPAPTGAP